MLNFIKKIFLPDEKKEWLDALFKNIESACEQGRYMHFRIIDIKEKGFLVKVGGKIFLTQGSFFINPGMACSWKSDLISTGIMDLL